MRLIQVYIDATTQQSEDVWNARLTSNLRGLEAQLNAVEEELSDVRRQDREMRRVLLRTLFSNTAEEAGYVRRNIADLDRQRCNLVRARQTLKNQIKELRYVQKYTPLVKDSHNPRIID